MNKKIFKPSSGYLQNLNSLYGDGKPAKKVPRRTPDCPTEQSEQIRFSNWLDDHEVKHYSIPNGRANATAGAIQKAMGQARGIPDLCVPYPSGAYHSLYIELKRVIGARVAPEQTEWLVWLRSKGFMAVVAYGCDEAIAAVKAYSALGGAFVRAQ